MNYTVRIEPSGHSFTALPEETLLEAALRSGINISYNCSNGSCGDCRAQLISGGIEAIPADYRFSIQEKNNGYVLLCSSRAASDLVLAAQEAHSSNDIPRQHITTKVVKIEARGEDIRIVHLRTPRTKTFRFLAGQHINLALPGHSSIDASIASCPCNGMQLQFHFRWQKGIPFIESVFSDLRSGDIVEIDGPFGEVNLADESQGPLLMLAVDEEFAPIKSLIEHAINLDFREPVRLYWLADRRTGHYLENHCRSWEQVLDDYRYIPLTIAGDKPDRAEIQQLLEAIGREVPKLAIADIYVAGPPQFQLEMETQLLQRGADAGRLFLPHRRSIRKEPVEISGRVKPVR